jgi:NAD+ synthase (glutamine-hydrolysing)
MRVGIGQINPHVGAIERNRDRILAYVNEARDRGCDLVVFPELAVCGYSPLDSVWRPGYVEACEDAVEAVRAASDGISVIVGSITAQTRREAVNRYDPSSLADGAETELFNTAVLIEDRRIVGRAHKIHLPSYDVYDERRYFSPGPGTEVFAFRGRTIGINVCEDLWVDGGPTELQASLGADWIINLSASPFYVGKQAIRHRLIRQRSKENGVGIVYANLVGGQDDVVFDGGSFIVDANGRLLSQAPAFTEGLFIVDLSDPRPVAYERPDDLDQLQSALVLGIRDYVAKNGFTSVVVGLSGGIDSALVTALAVEALGPAHVTAVYLPSEFSSEESREDAHGIARRLSIEPLEIPFADIHQALRGALPETPTGLTDENLQPRVRGTILMALANQRNALVLCPGNKSEIAMGYNTLYGDTIGALAPIADLYKADVYRLAGALGDRIPKRVLEKPPAAELRTDHRDEDDLPPYSVLDPLLGKVIEENRSRRQLIVDGFDAELVDRVLPRYYASEYKRAQLPPAIKVSPKAFGVGRRMPITNAYRD